MQVGGLDARMVEGLLDAPLHGLRRDHGVVDEETAWDGFNDGILEVSALQPFHEELD